MADEHLAQRRRTTPAERVTLVLLAVITLTVLARFLAGTPLGREAALHAALLVGYAALVYAVSRRDESAWAPLVRGIAVVAVLFTLYGNLAHLAFVAIPWLGDPALAQVDRWLFLGWSPVLEAERLVTPGRLEFLSFVYAFFIPYLYLSIFLGLVGRPDHERDEFITGFAILYALSFLGYLFVPARGPIVYQAEQFAAPLTGGYFHSLVTESIDRLGGPHGAFPSLHVGASAYACGFDMKHNRLRGLTYLPVVVLISLSTVLLRYHYVIDLVAGLSLAWLAVTISGRWLTRQRGIKEVEE